jgi:hypothetical protein
VEDVEDDADGADESGASRDDGDGDGVKEGLRSAGVKTEGADRPAFDAGGGAIIEPDPVAEGLGLPGPAPGVLDASSSAAWSPFPDWENQLVVAATACRTAWRPLSSTALAAVAAPPASPERPSPSAESAAEPEAEAEADSEADPEPAEPTGEPFGLPISSAGNGTRVENSVRPDASPLPEVSTSFSPSVPVSAALTSGSMSRPGGATITGGSVVRPASSTPSSSVPKLLPFVPSAETIRLWASRRCCQGLPDWIRRNPHGRDQPLLPSDVVVPRIVALIYRFVTRVFPWLTVFP